MVINTPGLAAAGSCLNNFEGEYQVPYFPDQGTWYSLITCTPDQVKQGEQVCNRQLGVAAGGISGPPLFQLGDLTFPNRGLHEDLTQKKGEYQVPYFSD